MLRWAEEQPVELALDQICESYARYRLYVPEAERGMMHSLERYGQISPVVVCQQEGRWELLDGFKRLGAARKLSGFERLQARRMETDERGAKAAIYGLNRAGGQRRIQKEHSPGTDTRRREQLLRQRFAELGDGGPVFFDQLLRARRMGKDEAQRILGLLAVYRASDLAAALERASRYRAFSLSAVERILTASATPRSPLESVDEAARVHLDQLLRENPVPPRSTTDYQQLLDVENTEPSEEEPR